MTKKDFQTACKRLEALGYGLVDYEPAAKFAKYELNGSVKIVGVRK